MKFLYILFPPKKNDVDMLLSIKTMISSMIPPLLSFQPESTTSSIVANNPILFGEPLQRHLKGEPLLIPPDHSMSIGSFSYRNLRINFVRLTEEHTIRIARIDEDVAKVYFVDTHGNCVPPPVGYVMMNSISAAVVPYIATVGYIIIWINSYDLRSGGECIFRLRNQKQQAMYAPGRLTSGMVAAGDDDIPLDALDEVLYVEDDS